MARTPRIKSLGEGTAYYHLISRCSNKQFLFRKAVVKDRLMELAKRAAEFSGVKLLALTVMDNHFHILCSVTQSSETVSQEEIIRRVGILKGDAAAQELRERWENFSAAGFTAMLDGELYRYRARMNDISAFMKTMKELFAIWYNRKYDYC
jgi:REP element-mobilizing transposase RayT